MSDRPEFNKLLAASFISQIGSYFLTIALAAFVLVSSGSPIQSAMIFVVTYLPSILVGAKVGTWIDASLSKGLLIRNEIFCVFLSALCGVCIAYHLPLYVLCIVLSLRSILMLIGRSGSNKWIKLISPPETQRVRFKIYSFIFFLSTAISGILAGVVLAKGSIRLVVTIDIVTYFVGILIYLSLRPIALEPGLLDRSEAPPQEVLSILRSIHRIPTLRTLFLLVCFSQALFQGAYSTLVSFLPIRQFQLGFQGVGSFQLATSLGIIAGFLLVYLFPHLLDERNLRAPLKAFFASGIGILALFACVSVLDPYLSLFFFFVLNCAYECIWLHSSSEFFRASPKAATARYSFTLSSCAGFLMSISTLSYAAAIQKSNLLSGTIFIVSAGLGFLLLTGYGLGSRSLISSTPRRDR
jgi:MFS family permease